jgi:hypothetical protein
MAKVEKLGGSWVIVREQDIEVDEELSDGEADAVREFWSGDGWVRQFGFAKQFWAEEEAQDYLVQHPRDLE